MISYPLIAVIILFIAFVCPMTGLYLLSRWKRVSFSTYLRKIGVFLIFPLPLYLFIGWKIYHDNFEEKKDDFSGLYNMEIQAQSDFRITKPGKVVEMKIGSSAAYSFILPDEEWKQVERLSEKGYVLSKHAYSDTLCFVGETDTILCIIRRP